MSKKKKVLINTNNMVVTEEILIPTIDITPEKEITVQSISEEIILKKKEKNKKSKSKGKNKKSKSKKRK